MSDLQDIIATTSIRAFKSGYNFGRKEGYRESMETFINKPTTKEIIELLSLNYTLREIAKIVECSTKTVQKVKNILKNPK